MALYLSQIAETQRWHRLPDAAFSELYPLPPNPYSVWVDTISYVDIGEVLRWSNKGTYVSQSFAKPPRPFCLCRQPHRGA
jgi:hypothetical protein